MIGRAGKAGMMRASTYLAVLAGVAVLAAGCGTERPAQAVSVAAAAVSTASQSTRVTVTTAMRTQGISVSFTETGVFDFADSRGLLRMTGPAGLASEELFVPPEIYLRVPGGGHGLLPRGKSWVAVSSAATDGLGTTLMGPSGGTDPGDLLASLKAAAGRVRTLGTATLRGVPVTHLRLDVDPAKAAAQVPPGQRAGFRAFATSLGAATIPVDVWVDQQDMVRQVRWSPHLPGGSIAPGGTRFTQTADFYDFGVPVRVSPPPAGEVASLSHLAQGMTKSAMAGASGSARPPRASGTLSPAQAAAAAAAVRAFWQALGRDDAQAAAQTVLPAQRSCFRSMLGGPHFTVTSLGIVSVQPDGNTRAAVRFTVKVRAKLGGQSIPVFPGGPGRVQWLVTTEAGGHWYVNLGRSSGLAFGPACN
jgi:hypothetical protein